MCGHSCGSCDEFFDLLEKVTPQFIFLDVVMPGEDAGISCLKKIRAQPKYDRIPIIMYSVSPSHMQECFKEKADFYLESLVHTRKSSIL